MLSAWSYVRHHCTVLWNRGYVFRWWMTRASPWIPQKIDPPLPQVEPIAAPPVPPFAQYQQIYAEDMDQALDPAMTLLLFLDTETTLRGFDILEIGQCAKVYEASTSTWSDLDAPFTIMIRPSSLVHLGTHIHGITEEMVGTKGVPFREALEQWLEATRRVILSGNRPYVCLVAHNGIAFDLRHLAAQCYRCDLSSLYQRLKDTGVTHILDTLTVLRRYRKRGRNSLQSLAEQLGITDPPHRALGDAQILAQVTTHSVMRQVFVNDQGHLRGVCGIDGLEEYWKRKKAS